MDLCCRFFEDNVCGEVVVAPLGPFTSVQAQQPPILPMSRKRLSLPQLQPQATKHLNGNPRSFPGAVNSRLTSKMNFLKPAEVAPIATYHVMDAESSVADSTREPPDVTDEQVLGWYKNMVTGELKMFLMIGGRLVLTGQTLVNIMDNIMFEAQRHGRLSFYMVTLPIPSFIFDFVTLISPRSPREKRPSWLALQPHWTPKM